MTRPALADLRSQLARAAADATSLVPAPTEDLPHVDMRRDAAGLPPLAPAVCAVQRTAGPVR